MEKVDQIQKDMSVWIESKHEQQSFGSKTLNSNKETKTKFKPTKSNPTKLKKLKLTEHD